MRRAGLLLIVTFLLLPETYPPTLREWKAAGAPPASTPAALAHPPLAQQSANVLETLATSPHSSTSASTSRSAPTSSRHSRGRSCMLVEEPIVVCFLAYLTLVYIVLFGSLVACVITRASFFDLVADDLIAATHSSSSPTTSPPASSAPPSSPSPSESSSAARAPHSCCGTTDADSSRRGRRAWTRSSRKSG